MTIDDLNSWAAANGYFRAAWLDEDRQTLVAVLRTVTGGQIIRGDESTVTDRWSYEIPTQALVSYGLWASSGFRESDPPGPWVRHQPSNRRRTYLPDGSIDREYTSP